MNILNKMFENKKNLYNIGIALFAGVVLMAMGSGVSEKNKNVIKEDTFEYMEEYEERIEEKISNLLEQADGVGKVKASVTLKGSREKVVQNDISYQTDEKELTQTKEKRTVYSNDDTPFVVVEREPEIEGVVIICEGGEDILIKEKIINSVSALLGVEVHKIEVLKMKQED